MTLRFFEFTSQERAKEDPEWAAYIASIRTNGTFLPSMLNRLKVLTKREVNEDPEWEFAPFVVRGNEERTHVNKLRMRAFAISRGVPIIAWRSPIKNTAITAHLTPQDLDSLYKDPRLYFMYAHGAPAFINENINPLASRKGPILL